MSIQVCTHASLALGSLPTYTTKQWSCVWSSTLTSLERSLQHDDFTEYRQAANLRTQVWIILYILYQMLHKVSRL